MRSAWPFVCSVCEEPLLELRGTLKCRAGHSFDIAKEGYVNLLAPADAERGISGDTRDMLHARRRFLDAGHFAPLREALGAEVREALATRAQRASASCVLEVGCGEGYYIGGIAASAPAESAPASRHIGLDVSRDAVRLAARRYPSARFAVANVRRRLYVGAGSVNALLSVFAPRNELEFRRVLADDGALIVAIPGPAHMSHVRDSYGLLDVEEAKEERILEQFGEHFFLAARQVIEYPVVLAPDHVRDFVAMGPSARHPRPAGVGFGREIRTLASFVVLRLRRRTPRPRGGRGAVRETIMTTTSTRTSRHVNAPRADVYRALLDPQAVAKWKVPTGMTCHMHTFDAREGGSFRVSLTYDEPTGTGKTTAHTDTYHGRFVKLVPNELVVEAMEFETADPAMRGEMTVTITLAEAGRRT